MQTVLAKALYDNIADNEDELTFRKGDVITVLEKDIDGLFGWWLCSLHGRQGIAPGNRLTEIPKGPKEPEPIIQPPSIEELDYAVPKPYEENGEDYDVPRSVYSPQDYDFPKGDSMFEYPENEVEKKVSPDLPVPADNIYQEIYDIPMTTPEKKKPAPLIIPGKKMPPKRPPSPQRGPQSPQKGPTSPQKAPQSSGPPIGSTSPTKTAPMSKPPRKSIIDKDNSLKPTQTPPPRPPKPASPRTPKETGPPQEVYDVPNTNTKPIAHTSSTPNFQSNSQLSSQMKHKTGSSASLESDSHARNRTASSNSTGSVTREEIYDVPSNEVPSEEIYDVPPSIRQHQKHEEGEIYDIPKHLVPTLDTSLDDLKSQEEPKFIVWQRQRLSEPSESSSRSSSGVSSELGGLSRVSGGSDLSSSRPGSDASDKGVSTRGPTGSGNELGVATHDISSSELSQSKRDSAGSGTGFSSSSNVASKRTENGTGSGEAGVTKRASGGSGGRRASNSSSTGSAGKSSEDDDYVDYQEIYGYGRPKPVNLYDVPVQPVPVSDGTSAPAQPATKQTKASILQRINMAAVKGIKLDPPAALQRLTKLEQAVDVTVAKLLSYVTTTWRDPTLLRSNVADIRDIAGKAKVVLRLLTEFGLSTLVNGQKVGQPELTAMISRAIEPLLETYYSLKLTLQRLDDTDWKAPLGEKKHKEHDDLDMIMTYMQGVPKNSKKLATVVRTAATILYKVPKEPLAPPTEVPKQPITPPTEVPKEPIAPPTETKEEQTTPTTQPPPSKDQSIKVDTPITDNKRVSSRIERFKPVAMEAESGEVNSTTMMVGLIKACVDANIKPGEGPKFSPETVRRLCGLSSNSSTSLKDTHGAETSPKLPPRRSDSITKDTNAPRPPTRQDSSDKLHHVRQKSLERFAPDGETTSSKSKVPPNPPPKPRLDRKPTIRKSYKYRGREDSEDSSDGPVKFRERLPGIDSPKEKRKCNSDPTNIERIAEDDNNNRKDKRVSDSIETTVPGNKIVSRTKASSPSYSSDSALPSSPTGQRSVTPLSPRLKEFQGNPRPDIQIQRSKSFTRTKPPAPKTSPFGENGMNNFILSFSDKELLEFYKYEIDAQLFVLNEAMKSLFASIDDNQPPKVFVSNSKFVVLSAHKFIYIGETLQSKISHDKLGSDISAITTKLSDCAKKLVQCTKMAALQYSAVTPMREMGTAASAVSEAAIELHKVVKLKTNS